MFKSSYVAYLKPSDFNNIWYIFSILYSLRFNCLFKFLNSIKNVLCLFMVWYMDNMGLPVLSFFLLKNLVEPSILPIY